MAHNQTSDRRVPALDGLRGLAGLMVIGSHYFGEVEHGLRAARFGWIGVALFFVLSGYLIGKLILEKKDCGNFFAVFYVRRSLRIIPAYMLTLVVCLGLLWIAPAAWADTPQPLPAWTYFTFLQVIPMAQTGSVGVHWLAPTWTLAVEEHFYLVVPAFLVFTPRRYVARILLLAIAAAVLLRIAVLQFHVLPAMSAFVLLPFRMDALACGLLAALAVHTRAGMLGRYMMLLRLTAPAMLVVAFAVRALSPAAFDVVGPLAIAIGCAAFILSLVFDAPEARRFQSPLLRMIGDNTYCLYLTHLAVLGAIHGLLLGTAPDLGTPLQWAATLAALPVTAGLAWLMTRYVEMPLTAWGRAWKWSAPGRKAPVLQPYPA